MIKNNENSNELYVKFFNSDLSVNKIEELIYQRDSLNSYVEKTIESMKTLQNKLKKLESEIKEPIIDSDRFNEQLSAEKDKKDFKINLKEILE